MKVLVALLLSYFCLTLATESKPELSQFQENVAVWNDWKIKHNKVYASEGEELTRFAIFLESIKRVEKKNLNAQNPVFGLTKFSDMTPEEFKSTYLGYAPRASDEPRPLLPLPQGTAPDTFDWRTQGKVTAVKDQGQCGSCWAFSVTENVESMWMIAKGISAADMAPLSPQEIVDCDNSDSGCNGGDPPTAYKYIQSAGGLETEKDYPYTATDGNCNFDSSKVYSTIGGWGYATQSDDENQMKTQLVTNGPLSICVDAETWSDYTGGILMASDCGTSLDHCVLAVGYDTSSASPFWQVRNSWGTTWGESGYIRLQFGQDTCGLATEATSACINCN